MRRLVLAAAALAAAACGGRESERAERPEQAANQVAEGAAEAPRPASARLDEMEFGNGAEPKAAAEADPAEADPALVARAWFVGRWSDSGDCAAAGAFEGNGTYRLADGTRGMWNVVDGRLIVQNAAGRNAIRLRRIDERTVEVINGDGSVGRSVRC